MYPTEVGTYHLSSSAVTSGVYLPTLHDILRYKPGKSAALPKSSPIEIYVTFQPARFILLNSYLPKMCALTAHFHPYPALLRDGIVSVTLSVFHTAVEPHPLDGAVPYVVRTFLISPKANRDRSVYNLSLLKLRAYKTNFRSVSFN